MKKNLDIPAIEFFDSKNDYTGSCKSNFRFKITPIDKQLKAEIWNEDICYEKATISQEKIFELTQEGLDECIRWISEA